MSVSATTCVCTAIWLHCHAPDSGPWCCACCAPLTGLGPTRVLPLGRESRPYARSTRPAGRAAAARTAARAARAAVATPRRSAPPVWTSGVPPEVRWTSATSSHASAEHASGFVFADGGVPGWSLCDDLHYGGPLHAKQHESMLPVATAGDTFGNISHTYDQFWLPFHGMLLLRAGGCAGGDS